MNLVELQKTVQDAIDKGATSVEQVHKQIASMPLDYLARIAALEGPANQVKEFQNNTIGSIYQVIHNVNNKAGEIAKELLAKIPQNPAAPN